MNNKIMEKEKNYNVRTSVTQKQIRDQVIIMEDIFHFKV